MKKIVKLSGIEEQQALKVLEEAATLAKESQCKRRRCAAILRRGYGVASEVGEGINFPPDEHHTRCTKRKADYDVKVTDKTCCVHAEQAAIIHGLQQNFRSVDGSTIYFTSIDSTGKRLPSGEPYCTICSKLALAVGIKTWVLEHEDGIYAYDAKYYNELSYLYGKVHQTKEEVMVGDSSPT